MSLQWLIGTRYQSKFAERHLAHTDSAPLTGDWRRWQIPLVLVMCMASALASRKSTLMTMHKIAGALLAGGGGELPSILLKAPVAIHSPIADIRLLKILYALRNPLSQ